MKEKAEIQRAINPNPWPDNRRGRAFFQQVVFGLFRVAAVVNGLALLIVVTFLVAKGYRAITWTFLTQPPMDSMTKGGILPCIIGTLCLSLGSMLVALPIGVASAIYLHEYARPGRVLRLIRLGINNLAGVPSVVFGLFGLAFFVVYMKMGTSLLAGSLTLGALTLPVIIGSAEEALRAVPGTYREASLGLGATKWQTICGSFFPRPCRGSSPVPSWELAAPQERLRRSCSQQRYFLRPPFLPLCLTR